MCATKPVQLKNTTPLPSGAHCHGGCPPAPSQEKRDHHRQQGAQHCRHSVMNESAVNIFN